jgi:hypothetical protein
MRSIEQRSYKHEIMLASLLLYRLRGGNRISDHGTGKRLFVFYGQRRRRIFHACLSYRHTGRWNTQAQGGINFFGGRAGLVGEFDFNHQGINSANLTNIGYPGGFTNVASFSVDPTIRFNPNGRVSFYLIGGPGVYHRSLDFTAPVGVTVPGFFGPDSFFTNGVVASYTTTKLGVNGGAGFTYRLGGSKVKFFGEARYVQMYTQHTMSWVPVTFGFRW